jgi:hypothetical protein
MNEFQHHRGHDIIVPRNINRDKSKREKAERFQNWNRRRLSFKDK